MSTNSILVIDILIDRVVMFNKRMKSFLRDRQVHVSEYFWPELILE